MKAHEIDYEIFGEEMQFVEIELDPQEGVVAEAGSFMMMDDQTRMDTIFGDGSGQSKDILGSLFSAGKRLLTGESLFMTVFTNTAGEKRKIPGPANDKMAFCRSRCLLLRLGDR